MGKAGTLCRQSSKFWNVLSPACSQFCAFTVKNLVRFDSFVADTHVFFSILTFSLCPATRFTVRTRRRTTHQPREQTSPSLLYYYYSQSKKDIRIKQIKNGSTNGKCRDGTSTSHDGFARSSTTTSPQGWR